MRWIPRMTVAWCLVSLTWSAEAPPTLVVEGVPEIGPELRENVLRYREFRSAEFSGWVGSGDGMLVLTRFSDTRQVHWVRGPGLARRQLTFFSEPVGSAVVQPGEGRYVILSRDTGGAESYQLYRYDLIDGRATPLTTEGRNTGVRFSPSGRWFAYASTRRTGRDTDIYVMDPGRPGTDRMVVAREGGGWSVADWDRDEKRLLLSEYVSINESYLHLCDVETGGVTPLVERGTEPAAYGNGRFAADGDSIYVATDVDSEFKRLVRMELTGGEREYLSPEMPHDVELFELSPSGRSVAYVINQEGASVLRIAETRRGRTAPEPRLPSGVIAGLEWDAEGGEVGLTYSSATATPDAYSVEVRTGRVTRWTESETGGIDVAGFAVPETVKLKSFDELEISAMVYRPDARRFPGKRPVIVLIHGGPESQSRPGFLGGRNYYLDWPGVALVVPNVRGSRGYGKSYLRADNGYRREDSVRDIGVVLEWIRSRSEFDSERVAVMGGSYGGYMVLASMVHYGDWLRCGVDVVGISNFVSFLESTRDYRRDLRRAEYGDERDPSMREFLEKISPANRASEIKSPLLVVQGQNDPRVPLSESERMVGAIRAAGGTVWYVMARDEGHGFRKKINSDYEAVATARFFYEFLLK